MKIYEVRTFTTRLCLPGGVSISSDERWVLDKVETELKKHHLGLYFSIILMQTVLPKIAMGVSCDFLKSKRPW